MDLFTLFDVRHPCTKGHLEDIIVLQCGLTLPSAYLKCSTLQQHPNRMWKLFYCINAWAVILLGVRKEETHKNGIEQGSTTDFQEPGIFERRVQRRKEYHKNIPNWQDDTWSRPFSWLDSIMQRKNESHHDWDEKSAHSDTPLLSWVKCKCT